MKNASSNRSVKVKLNTQLLHDLTSISYEMQIDKDVTEINNSYYQDFCQVENSDSNENFNSLSYECIKYWYFY